MAGSGTTVAVEVLLLRLDDGQLCYRSVRDALVADETPDAAALRIAQITDQIGVCHSTSWRHEHGTVVLTYAVVPDPVPQLPATPLVAPAVVCSGDPLRPAPAELHAHHIVAHAVRHLAYLADTDPAVAAVAQIDSAWSVIRQAGANIPAAVHDVAHQMAERRMPRRLVPTQG